MYSLWGYHQTLNFWVKVAIFGPYPAMPADFGQRSKKIFRLVKGDSMLVQNFKLTGEETTSLDPKMLYPNTNVDTDVKYGHWRQNVVITSSDFIFRMRTHHFQILH